MDALSLVALLLFRSLIVLMPVFVAMLAFRRLALSQTVNAWLYASTGLIASVTAAGLLPWAIAGAQASWMFFVLAPLCPALWLGVVIICDMDRPRQYDPSGTTDLPPRGHAAPLVLERPEWPGTPTPMFRHREAEDPETEASGQFVTRRAEPGIASNPATSAATVLEIARAMRGNVSSQHRREPRRLPPPPAKNAPLRVESLPFLRPRPQV